MLVEDPLFWFGYRTDDGDPWMVYLATEKGVPQLVGNAGICFKRIRDIYVSLHEEETEFIETALHELDHSTLVDCVTKRGKRRIHHRTEEYVICHREPRFRALAQSLGWKLPRKPRGYGALRAMATEMNDKRGGR